MSSPYFSSGIVEWAKPEHVWKSPHGRKARCSGERKMRDYRKSPSFWPFTCDWFWSVKFVSPSKSIKCIQWDSFSYWAVIALVIGKLGGYSNSLLSCFAWRTWQCKKGGWLATHDLYLMPKCCLFQWIFFIWWVDYALEENVLTE